MKQIHKHILLSTIGIGLSMCSSLFIRTNAEIWTDTNFVIGSGVQGGGISTLSKNSDGSFLAGGSFTGINNTLSNQIALITSNGGVNGVFAGSGFNGTGSTIYQVMKDGNGKIYVAGGNWTTYQGNSVSSGFTRLNTDGTIDTAFLAQWGLGCNNSVRSFAFQPLDGKIILGGDFIQCKSISKGGIVRIISNGQIDTTFNASGVTTGFSGIVDNIKVQQNGNILVGGSFTGYNNVSTPPLIRLTSSGGIDGFFNFSVAAWSGNFIPTQVHAIREYNGTNAALSGTIYVITTLYNSGASTFNPYLLRIFNNGIIDITFPPYQLAHSVNTFIQTRDDRIILSQNNDIIRINTNSTLDIIFNTGGALFNGNINTILLVDDPVEGNTPLQILVAGNFSLYGTGNANGIHKLNISPNAPFDPVNGPSITSGTDSGHFSNDGITNTLYPIFTGTGCMNGNTVSIRVDGGLVGTGMCVSNGYNIMSTLPISHGTHTITTHFSNLGGTSNSSPINTLEVDTIAPTIVPTIISPASGSTLSQKRPTITGTGESNGIVFTTINGVTYTGASDIGGNWTIIPTNDIPDGTYNVFVRFEDKAGNPAPAVSNTIRITIKTAAPSTPIIQNPYQNAVINSAIPTFQGTGFSGYTIAMGITGYGTSTTLVNGSGNWSLTPSFILPDATYTANFIQIDELGNTSAITQRTFSVNTSSPIIPNVPDMVDASDTGSSIIDNITNVQRPTFFGNNCSGTGDIVVIKVDGVNSGTGMCSATGSYTIQVSNPITEGNHAIYAAYVLSGGYASADSNALLITIDVTNPQTFTLNGLDYTGVTVTPFITYNVQRPVFRGTTEPNTQVSVITPVGAALCTTTSLADGTYACTAISPLPEGQNTLSMTLCDIAGNCRTPLTNLNTIIDITPPPAPTILYPTYTGAVTTNQKPNIKGSGSANHIIAVTINSSITYTGRVDSTGVWTIAIPDTLANGTHTIRVVQRDNAGNESLPVTTSITIDTNMVNGLSLTSPAPGGYLQTASLSGIQFKGTCATGSIVYMESPINATGACTLTNTWSITGNLSTLPNGTVYVTIRQKDIGDSFTPLQPYYFTKDTNPAILSFSSSVMPGGGSINPIFVTLTTSETLTGLTAANIEVTSGSTLSGFTKVSGTNNYTFSLRPNDEYFGRVAFNVLTGGVTDLAGNAVIPPNSASYWTFIPYSPANLYTYVRIQETQQSGNSYSTITTTIDYGNNGDTAVNSGTLNIKLDSRLTFVDAYIANDTTGRKLSLIEKAYADSTNTAWGSYNTITHLYTVKLGKLAAKESARVIITARIVKNGSTAINVKSSIFGQTEYSETVRESAIDDNDAIGTYLLNEYDLLDNYLSGLTAATNPLKKNTCGTLEEAVPYEEIAFTDIADHWAKKYIKKITQYGIEQNGLYYGADLPLTRSEFIGMITNALNCKYSSTELFEAIPTFTDIKEDLWTYHFIGIAEQLGWLNNTTGYFRPDDTLTRSEAVHMLITVLHGLNAETTGLSNFMDIEDTPFFQKSIIIAQYYGIIDGTKIGGLNYFFPHNEILRGEAAKIISKTFLE